MSKWKCGICGSEFDNFQAQGFEGTIYCPLCYFKKLYKDTELEREKLNRTNNEIFKANETLAEEIKKLQNQLQQKENIIKKVRKYIMTELISQWDIENDGYVSSSDLPADAITPILEILDKGE